MLSPFLNQSLSNSISDSQKYYTGLMIGPYLLKFDETGICIPKKCTSEASLIAADIDSLFPIQNLEEVLSKVSKVIQDWNVKKTFLAKRGKNEDPSFGNSQLFVDDLLQAIGSKYTLPVPFQKFLDRIRKKGYSRFKFEWSKEFIQKFKIEKDVQRFFTHSDLDEFVQNLRKIDPKFDTNYKQESMFLKGLDRAFWMKYYHYEQLLEDKKRELKSLEDKEKILKCKNEITRFTKELAVVSPKENEDILDCAYGDPKQTSFMV